MSVHHLRVRRISNTWCHAWVEGHRVAFFGDLNTIWANYIAWLNRYTGDLRAQGGIHKAAFTRRLPMNRHETTPPEPNPKAQDHHRPFLAPGWYPDLSNEDYHASFGFSSSQLKTLVEHTPAHLRHSFTAHREATENRVLGTLVHSLVLEPETFANDYILAPQVDKRTRAGREEWAAFEAFALSKGLTVITDTMLNKARAMAASVREHPMASALLKDRVTEGSVYWWYDAMEPEEHEDDRLMLKVRPDALSCGHAVIIDLKTTTDASYSGFIRAIQRYQYHLSAAMYLDGVNQCTPLLAELGGTAPHLAFNQFVFVCVESVEPHLTAVYELSPAYIDLGRTLYRRALRRLHEGLRNDWPGYDDEVRLIEPPAWANRRFIV